MTSLRLIAASAGTLLLTACATTETDPTRVEQDFGKSVRQMIAAQIYDPVAAQNPPKDPPQGLDGMYGEAVLKAQREHVGDPNDVSKQMRLEVSP